MTEKNREKDTKIRRELMLQLLNSKIKLQGLSVDLLGNVQTATILKSVELSLDSYDFHSVFSTGYIKRG